MFSSFLASLHWPQGTPDLGKFGISYFELLLMFEVIDCILRKLFAATSFPVDPWFFGFFSWYRARDRHGCQFLHSLFRALGHLPGGLARFILCQPSAHYARVSHSGWGVMDMVSLLALVRVVTINFSFPF